jgi:ligand-binding sensor domain-containing protein
MLRGQLDCSILHYSVEDGLSENNVSCIYQDSRDYLWVGTFNGLNRFDGYRFKHYKTISTSADEHELSNDRIVSIDEDIHGFLWVGTYDGGVYRFDVHTEKFTPVSFGEKETKTAISSDIRLFPNGDVWIWQPGRGCHRVTTDPADHSLTVVSFSTANGLLSDSLLDIRPDSACNAWLMSNGGLSLLPLGEDRLKPFPTPDEERVYVVSMLEQKYSLLFGRSDGQLWQYDKLSGEFRLIALPFRHPIRQISELHENRFVVLSHEEGFLIYDFRQGIIVQGDADHFPALRGSAFSSLYVDSRREVWLGTHSPGVFHFDSATGELRRLMLPMDNIGIRLPSALFFEDPNGYM